MEIITNLIAENNHSINLKKLFKDSNKIFMAIAFLKKSGLDCIFEDIKASLKNGTEIKIICGLGFYQTDPKALGELLNLFKENENGELFIFRTNIQKTFHPKFYLFKNDKNATIVIGSANCTSGGFKDNTEISIVTTVDSKSSLHESCIEFFNNLLKSSDLIDEIKISQYSRKYDEYNNILREAKKEAKTTIKGIPNINDYLLKKYLDLYNKSNDKSDYINIKDDYLEAKKILEGIANNDLTEDEFFNKYELLVGKKGQRPLWHSASMDRRKGKVRSENVKFKEMLLEIKNNLDRAPMEIYEVCYKYIENKNEKKISGISVSVLTEILNTYNPDKYPVLNGNPVASLEKIGLEKFPHQYTKPVDYERFTNLMSELKNNCKFENYREVDQFLNYVYQNFVKKNN